MTARPPVRRMMLSHLLPDLAPYVAPPRPPVRRMSLDHLMPEPEDVAAVEVVAPVPKPSAVVPATASRSASSYGPESAWPVHTVVRYRDEAPSRHRLRVPAFHRLAYREATEDEEAARAARPVEPVPEDDAYGPWGAPEPALLPSSLADVKRGRRR